MRLLLLFVLLVGCEQPGPPPPEDGHEDWPLPHPDPPVMYDCMRDASACGGQQHTPAGSFCGYGQALLEFLAITRCTEQFPALPQECCGRLSCKETTTTCARAEHPCFKEDQYCGPIEDWP